MEEGEFNTDFYDKVSLFLLTLRLTSKISLRMYWV